MNKYIIWGLGNQGQFAYQLLKNDVVIEAFIDHSPDLLGTTYENIKVISFQDYLNRKMKTTLLISPRYNTSIIKMLKENHVDNYMVLSDLLNTFYFYEKFPMKSNYFTHKEYEILFKNFISFIEALTNNYCYTCYFHHSSTFNFKRDSMNINCPVISDGCDETTIQAYNVIFNNKVQIVAYDKIPDKADLLIIHGLKLNFMMKNLVLQAGMKALPHIFGEEGFIRSITSQQMKDTKLKYRENHSLILDSKGLYINANTPSDMEQILNSDMQLSTEQKNRAINIMNLIKTNKISKYNHQPIIKLNVGRPGHKKVLVIDQVYGDASIGFGRADNQTFSNMLQAAIDENPDADILVKTHPVGKILKGYFTDIETKDNIYKIDFAINPISLLEQVDKVYVCTSQMGFEAMICGKEVHIFGMPFYGGWNVETPVGGGIQAA